MFENPHYYEMQASVYRSMMQAEAEQARWCAPLHCPKRVMGYLFLAQVGVFLVRVGLAVERIAQVKTQRVHDQLLDQTGMASRLP
jgi:hypothetical protein